MGEYSFFVFSNPVQGREQEFNDWYSNEHLQDNLAVPGFPWAQRFKRQTQAAGELKQAYLVVYGMEATTQADAEAAIQTMRDAGAKRSSAMDSSTLVGVIYEGLGPRLRAEGSAGDFQMIVLADAVDGREDEFNAWYDSIHLGEVLSVPGFVHARRLKRVWSIGAEPPAPRYMAIYGHEAGNAEQAGAALQSIRDAKLQPTEAMRRDLTSIGIYQAITEKIAAPARTAAAG